MTHIKLSVCMATRNRANFIGATLQSIISQATSQVEIIVLDGASTDRTCEVVRRHQADFPQLRYIRQDVNMGVDRDFAQAVSLANGEYCWLFSDDDLMKPGAIQAVLNAMDGRYGLIIANAEIRNADLSRVLERQKLQLKADRIYKSTEGDDLLSDVGNYMSFIGCVIVRRQFWNEREKKKYFGSCFVHVGVVFQGPILDDTLVIAKPLISIRYGNAMWLDRYFEIWMFKWPELIWSFAGYADSAKRRVCRKEPWKKIKTLLIFRAKGAYTTSDYRRWLQPRLESWWTRGVSATIAHFPGRFANFLGFVWYALFDRHSSWQLNLIDLRNSLFCFWSFRPQQPQRTMATPEIGSGRVNGPSPAVPPSVAVRE